MEDGGKKINQRKGKMRSREYERKEREEKVREEREGETSRPKISPAGAKSLVFLMYPFSFPHNQRINPASMFPKFPIPLTPAPRARRNTVTLQARSNTPR